MRNHDPLGERAPSAEPRLLLPVADLLVTCQALSARSARVDERSRYAITHRPSIDVNADLINDAGELMTGHMRQRHQLVSHPGVPVTATQTGGPDGDDDAVARAQRLRKLGDLRHLKDLSIDHSFMTTPLQTQESQLAAAC